MNHPATTRQKESAKESTAPLEIVLATTNMHKVREFRAMFKGISNIDLLSLCDFPDYVPPEETGTSFEENAVLKASNAAKTLNRRVLAEDSGLTVPALGNAPGIFSARYAGENATDLDNRKKLLSAMSHLNTEEERYAFYECCIVIASPSSVQKIAKSICEGTILSDERGRGGFGYDPLFVKHGYHKSFAEMDESVKNRISHRRKAFDKILSYLEQITQ